MTTTDRTEDATQKRDELKALLGSGDAAKLLDAARRALLALEFRATDEMIGLDNVDGELLEELDELVLSALAEAASLGSHDAAFELGELRLGGGDAEAALAAMVPAAEAGHAKAAARAAEIVWRTEQRDRLAEAAKWLEGGAAGDEDGNVHYIRALFAFNGVGRKKDLAEAVALHEQAAARGHGGAMFELYAMLSQGLGRARDPAQAVEWCVKAAEAGHVRAMANLGSFYATGNGVPKDPAKAVEWYERAAEAGHGKAAATLGIMYATGDGVEADEERARDLFSLAEDLEFDWRELAESVGLDPDDWE